MRKIYVLMLFALSLLAVSCSKEDTYDYPDDTYGVYIVNTEGGDLGMLLAKYDILLYPYIGVEGKLQYSDFQLLKHLQRALMYLNLEKVTIDGYQKEDGEVIESNTLHQDHMQQNGRIAFPLLHTVILPRDLTEIGERTFYSTNMTKLVAYNRLTTIGESAFENNIKLSELNLPKSLKYIAENAFKGCTSLTQVVIPSSVSVLYENSFDDRYVKSIHIKSKTPPELKETYDSSVKSASSKPTIYVPKGSLERYKNDGVWKDYRIIEE